MAAAAAADTRDAAAPPELLLAWRCSRYRALPRSGGIDDQPAGLLERMSEASFVYDAMRLHLRLPAEEFRAGHPDHYAAWQEIVAERMRAEAVSRG